MAEFNNTIVNNINISGEDQIRKLETKLKSAQDEIDRVNAKLQQTGSILERVRNENAELRSSSGFDFLEEELDKYRQTASETAEEFKNFLVSVNLNDINGSNDYKFYELIEKIEEGAITASQAITQVKTDYAELIRENYNTSGGLFDSQMVQQFTSALERLEQIVNSVQQSVSTMMQDGVKAIGSVTTAGTSSGISNIPDILGQIENAARGMSDEVKESYSYITNLVKSLNEYASIDADKLYGVSQAFKNIADMGKGRFGTKSVANIINLTKQLQTISESSPSIRFDFTGLNELKVSKASLSNLAEYLPQLASIKMDKLERLSKIDFSNLNKIKVSKSSVDSIAQLAEAVKLLKDAKVATVSAEDNTINIDTGEEAAISAAKTREANAKASMAEAKAAEAEAKKVAAEEKAALNTIKRAQAEEKAAQSAANANKEKAYTIAAVNNQYSTMLTLLAKNPDMKGTEVYNQLDAQIKALDTVINESNGDANLLNKALSEMGTDGVSAMDAAKNAASAFKVELSNLKFDGVSGKDGLYEISAQMKKLLVDNSDFSESDNYKELNRQFESISFAISMAKTEGLTLNEALQRLGIDGAAAIEAAKSAMSAFKKEVAEQSAVLTPGTKKYETALKRITTLINQIRVNSQKWSAAEHGQSSAAYNTYVKQENELRRLEAQLRAVILTEGNYQTTIAKITGEMTQSAGAIRAAGEATQTYWKRLGSLSEKFTTWFSITRVIMSIYRSVKQMVTSVIELDAAMTELKKVTDETDKRYEQFLTDAAVRAKQLGATLTDTVNATADFARLGYNIDEAEKLADVAIIYKNVGDGIENINEASQSVIATMQAFGLGAENAMSIVDKFNAVGNNYAISSKGVGDSLLRSAAAMKAANNTLDETIALAAAANTIVQDPEKVGTTLKTVSMYLRAAKTEAEEAGEATDGMANSVSELRDSLLALTGNRVDIQIDEDTFKSTYQILRELSSVWKSLSDVSRANILEMIGGKRNANVVSALLENFSVAEKAVNTSAESAGSALAENEVYLDSINGKIAILQATFQAFSEDVVNSDVVKFVIDAGTALINVLDALQEIHILLPSIAGIIASIGFNKQGVGGDKMYSPILKMPTIICAL